MIQKCLIVHWLKLNLQQYSLLFFIKKQCHSQSQRIHDVALKPEKWMTPTLYLSGVKECRVNIFLEIFLSQNLIKYARSISLTFFHFRFIGYGKCRLSSHSIVIILLEKSTVLRKQENITRVQNPTKDRRVSSLQR